ncbi:MAG: helix-turn-helix domain-containing protein [Deltaproteobacteria bacterium]|nr:helix-turn-helix domain-containing protein [Deltaproteobacteria bacterium]
MPTDPDAGLTREQAGVLLGVSAVTLDQWRYAGKGPVFFRVGTRGVRYRRADVVAYRDARTVGRAPLAI